MDYPLRQTRRFLDLGHISPQFIRGTIKNYGNEALKMDIDRLRQSWADTQNERDRDGIYQFLTEVFEIVAWWTLEKRARERSRRMLAYCDIAPPFENEPFGALIIVAAHPTKLDKRTISKWSRVLRFAAVYKLPSETLMAFLKGKGGLNKCAGLYARRLGRLAKNPTLRSIDRNSI